MIEHTKEPWAVDRDGDVFSKRLGTPVNVLLPRNKRRLVACVNACPDLPTELLESLECGLIPANETADSYRERAEAAANDAADVLLASADVLVEASKAEARATDAERLLQWALPLVQLQLEATRQGRLQAGHNDISAGTDHVGLWEEEFSGIKAIRAFLNKPNVKLGDEVEQEGGK